jgi:UDP-2-acetamido-2-deoxy-ribo-hexuluronate aminotransferase
MREIRAHGQDRRYHHPRIGINGRLDTLQAAILLAKLDRFDWEVARRQAVGDAYSAKIAASCRDVGIPVIASYNTSVYAQYTIQLEDRDEIARRLNEAGVPTAVHYPLPLHRQPAFAALDCARTSLVEADAAAARVLSLPMGPDLEDDVQDRIVASLRAAVTQFEKATT